MKNNSFESFSEWSIEWISCFLDIDPEDVEMWEWSKVLSEIERAKLTMDNWVPPHVVDLENAEFYQLPFHKLTLGEFIDLEYYLTDEKWITHVCSILYRRRTSDPLNGYTWESYGDWVEWRSKLWLHAPAECSKIVKPWLEWRTDLLNKYSGLFNIPTPFDPELTEQEKRDILRQEEKQSAFSWESTLLMLSNDRADRVPEILKMPLLLVLNLLSSLKKNKK